MAAKCGPAGRSARQKLPPWSRSPPSRCPRPSQPLHDLHRRDLSVATVHPAETRKCDDPPRVVLHPNGLRTGCLRRGRKSKHKAALMIDGERKIRVRYVRRPDDVRLSTIPIDPMAETTRRQLPRALALDRRSARVPEASERGTGSWREGRHPTVDRRTFERKRAELRTGFTGAATGSLAPTG